MGDLGVQGFLQQKMTASLFACAGQTTEWHLRSFSSSGQTGVQCSTRTVHGQLLDYGLRSYKAVKKPLINERQRLARRRWAQAHKNWTARNWKKILWSDESIFHLIFLLLMWGYAEGHVKHYLKHVQYLLSSMEGVVPWFRDAWVMLVLVISLSVMAHWYCQVLCHSRIPHAPICTCTVPSRSKLDTSTR